MRIVQQAQGRLSDPGAGFTASLPAATLDGSCMVILVAVAPGVYVTAGTGASAPIVPLAQAGRDTGAHVYPFYVSYPQPGESAWDFNVSGSGAVVWQAFEVTGAEINQATFSHTVNGALPSGAPITASPGSYTTTLTGQEESDWTTNNAGSPGWGLFVFGATSTPGSDYDSAWTSGNPGDTPVMYGSLPGVSLATWIRMSDTDLVPDPSTLTTTAGPVGTMAASWVAIETGHPAFHEVEYTQEPATLNTPPPPDPIGFTVSRDGLTVACDPDALGPGDLSWRFGDGATSSSLYPTHTYAGSGTWTISLDHTTANGTTTTTQTVYVQAPGDSDRVNGGAGGYGGTDLGDLLRLEVLDDAAAGTWTDRLPAATVVKVKRPALNVGTLTATFKGTALDPATSPALKAGKRVRLTARVQDGEATYRWESLFEGTISRARLVDGAVTMTAADPTGVLAATRVQDGVATVAELGHVLSGVDVEYDVGPEDYGPTVAYENGRASALDHVVVTRDTVHGHAWVSRSGVLKARAQGGLSQVVSGRWDEDDYSAITVGYNTQDTINQVRVRWLRYLPTSGASEAIDYGPYRDEASVTEWGVRGATFTICGDTEDAVAISRFADEVLAANAVPSVRINTMRLPVKRTADVAESKALVDLYDLVEVSNADRGIVGAATRVVGVTHTIRPDRWLIDTDLAADGLVAVPQVTPDPKGPPVPRVLDDLEDVNTATAADGQTIVLDGGVWVPGTPSGGGASALDDLSDVDTATAADGQVLTHQGGLWVPGDATGGASTLGGLSDVDTTVVAPHDGSLLTYNAGAARWEVVTDDTWHQIGDPGEPGWQNGFRHVNASNDPVQFRRDANGAVWLRGRLTIGGQNRVAFTFPVGYRPSSNMGGLGIGHNGNDPAMTCSIFASGDVKFYDIGDAAWAGMPVVFSAA